MNWGPCAHCGRSFDEVRFPLARPRRDGSRYPFRYCDECLALPARRGGGITAARLAAKLSRRRARFREVMA